MNEPQLILWRRYILWTALVLPLTVPCWAAPAARYIQSSEDIPRFSGLAPEHPEHYKAIPKVATFRAFLPAALDLSGNFPPPASQGQQGSCVAWSTAYAARSYYRQRREGVDVSNAENIASPAFIYNTLRKGDCSGGLTISSALGLLKEKGAVPLSVLPYNAQDCSTRPAADTLAKYSAQFKISGFKRLDPKQQDDIKGQLYQGNPVIFGMNLPEGFERYKQGVITDTVGEANSGHAMVVTGYDDAKQAFRIINSWGQRWGEKGYGWISYATFAELTQSSYVMTVEAPPLAVPPTPPQRPVLSAADLNTGAPCSALTASLSGNATNGYTVSLAGFVGARAELDKVAANIKAHPSVVKLVSSAVELRPWPQCEALLTLAPALSRARGASLLLQGHKNRLKQGDTFVIEAKTPDFAGFVYLAYIQADGSAVHLKRPSLGPTPAHSVLRIGDAPDQPRLQVTPPLGHETIILLVSPKPLLDSTLLGEQSERNLLTAYRQALLKPEHQDVSAALLTLETLP